MGYSTDLNGAFGLNKPLDDDLYEYLNKFAYTRRMARDLPDEFGVEGEYYVDGGGLCGQDHEPSIIEYNRPPSTQPGLWCQWVPSEDRMSIQWDGNEKFYHYTEWIEYLIKEFLAPAGYILNGQVRWQGEDVNDFGVLEIKDNKVIEHCGIRVISSVATSQSQIKFLADELMSILRHPNNINEEERQDFINTLQKRINRLAER